MRQESSDPSGLPYPPVVALATLHCAVTQLEVGPTLEDAQRYAETVAARLETAIEALEALGVERLMHVLRGWLERWLEIVELLFQQRLEVKQSLFDARA